MQAIRFHYRPVRYLLTRFASARSPALALGSLGCISLDQISPPALPGPDWVRVDSTLSGICGSDLAAITAHDSFLLEPFGAFPFTLGHENVGKVSETGATARDWQIGDRVIVNPMLACRQRGLDPCPACLSGEYGVCRRTREGDLGTGPMIGYSGRAGGGWSGSFVAHTSQLHRAGDLPDETGVLTDPFASALRPVLLHPPRADDNVLVIGVGTIGALTIKALRLTGWRGNIAVVARHPFQQQVAERAGANTVLRDRDALYAWAADLPQASLYKPSLAARFVEGGPSLVYDTVGTQDSLADALALTREAGRIVLVGAAAKVTVDWTRIWYRQLTVAGVFAYGLAPFEDERRDIYDISLELMRREDFGALGLVTHVFDLEEYRAGLAAALDKNGHRSIKVAFRPERGRG